MVQVSKISGLNRVQHLLENLPQIHSVWIFTLDTAEREETSFPSLFLPSCSRQHWGTFILQKHHHETSTSQTEISTRNQKSRLSMCWVTKEPGGWWVDRKWQSWKNGLTSLKNQGVLLSGSLCLLDDEQQPWHIQRWRWGIISWHGWVVEHEYILHRALFFLFKFSFFVSFLRRGLNKWWMDAGV